MRVPPESSAITDLWSWRDTARSQTTDLVKLPGSATGQRCKKDGGWALEPNAGLPQTAGGRPT